MDLVNRIIDWSLSNRALVLVIALLGCVVSAVAIPQLEVDAFPDTTPVQVQINTVAPALGPEQVELQLTAPIERAIRGLPNLENVRSVSKFGLSQITVTFEDGVAIHLARQLVGERLAGVELPPGIDSPQLGPVTTGLGEVFHYLVTADSGDAFAARQAQDWIIAPALRTVPGVAEVNSWGGYEKQIQIRIDPRRLWKHELDLERVIDAIERGHESAGGGALAQDGNMLLVRGLANATDAGEIGAIVVEARAGIPIRVRDLAEIEVGAEIRRGAVTAGGRGEAVLGIGFMLTGENTHEVTSRLKERLAEVAQSLPEGIHIETLLDRTDLVDHVLATVANNLFEGGLLVIAVLFIFLGNLRAGLIVAAAIPLSMLFAFSGMLRYGIAGSLMSLGAIDFGMVVDSAVIQVENAMRRLRMEGGKRSKIDIVRDAVVEVRRPTLFGELIIILVYVPILTLEGVEGKLFRPMALTVVFALIGSLILSLTLIPVLASLLLPNGAIEREPWLVRLTKWLYRPVLRWSIEHRFATVGFGIAITLGGVIVARGLGSEFVPRLSEGTIVANVVRLAGTDLSESVRYNTRIEQALLAAFPREIDRVWSRMGTAEVATDPMGVELTDVFISLRPRSQWQHATSQSELVERMARELRDLPGQRIVFTQPIEMRMNEMIAGVRGDVALKLYGDDLTVLSSKAGEIGRVLGSIPGASDLSTEQITGQPVLEIQIDRDASARLGVDARAVMQIVAALGSLEVGEIVDGQIRFPLVVRLPERDRRNADAIAAISVVAANGARVPLGELARISEIEGPSTITREWGQRRIAIQVNVRGRDIGSFVAQARDRIASEVELPKGRYHLEWGGQFENMERARERLMVVVPLVLALIVVLLFLTYGNIRDAARVFLGVPFAVIGGVAALWIRGMPFSISAAVGFIALSGVAVLGDMVLVSRIRQLLALGRSVRDAVEEACLTRLRPVLMTALVAALGFVPMAFNQGVGAEVQRPLATVVVGGVLSSTILTLLVLPAIYVMFTRKPSRTDRAGLAPPAVEPVGAIDTR